MFDWFKKPDYKNVVPLFPAPKAVPYIEPPKQEKESTTYYSIGHTDDNRVSIRMGHTTLTMNYVGVQHLIDQLELYKDQLHKEEE
jgi:hypothetical protein